MNAAIEAWKALVQLREMEKRLEEYCFGGLVGPTGKMH